MGQIARRTSISFAVPEQLHIEALVFEGGGVTILASTCAAASACPVCGRPSRRVHSYYTRTVADLPWGGVPVRFRVRVRKFFCDDPGCARRIFAERLDGVAQRYARRTDRQREVLDLIAFTLGGEAGTRLAVELGLRISPDTLLNYIRCSPEACYSAPRALGVDDGSLRKGQTYGTILVDLERRRVIDLLPDRSADALAAWLRDHPGVEVITRDGSNTYADGAARGAPDATQVADRFHLVANLREALRQMLERYREHLPPAGPEAAVAPEPGGCHRSEQDRALLGSYGRGSEREEREREESRARRLERYERMLELRKLGWSIKRIAAELGVSARTIERWLVAGSCPERRRRTGARRGLEEYKGGGVSWPISQSMSRYAAGSYAWCSPPRIGRARTLPASSPPGTHRSGAAGTRCCRPWCGRAMMKYATYSRRMRRRGVSPRTSTWSRHSRRTLPRKRSHEAFCLGARYAVRSASMPVAAATRANAGPYLLSLS